MRENRPYGSEGGGGVNLSLPLSEEHEIAVAFDMTDCDLIPLTN